MGSLPSAGVKPNRLINEKSPYLLQHARNPVDWYPWGEEAFARAAAEDKPVFLSIGYASCHWCHVMERESFSDPQVGKLLNETFVCVKVDREERPDVDGMYQAACQLLNGSGGWPLTVFLTPARVPFFAETYVPKDSAFGRPGLRELVSRVRDMWRRRRGEIDDTARRIMERLRAPAYRTSVKEEVDKALLESCFRELSGSYDRQNGGFGEAPKFPAAHHLMFLLRYHLREPGSGALAMAEKTLDAMRAGGIYDQIGFGFHRYSTDREWLLPHFEKMLYDQAQLALACVETFQLTRLHRFRQTADEVLAYVLRELRSPQGGFYSSQDADSEGEEGKYYYWTEQELREALSPDDAALAVETFNVKKEGNFCDPLTGQSDGRNVLHTARDRFAAARSRGMTAEEYERLLAPVRAQLLRARQRRAPPAVDDKVLTDWNGLMIAALARAAQVFGNEAYAGAAKKAADFIAGGMDEKRRQLWHRYRDGQWSVSGFIDDYAFFVAALLELYETTFEIKYLTLAVELTGYMLKHFRDDAGGGFFFTSDVAERMPVRKKEFFDTAYPSGNSVALLNLLRLARITGNSDYEERAEEIAAASSALVVKYPAAFTQQMQGLDFALGPSLEIVISGVRGREDTARMIETVRRYFLPRKVTLFRPDETEPGGITGVAKFTENLVMLQDRATAYVCRDYRCELPLTDPGALEKLIGEKETS